MNQYFGHPLISWANQNLQPPVEVKLKGNSIGNKIFLGFCFVFLAFIFLGIPLLFNISAIKTLLDTGWSEKVLKSLISGTAFLIIYVAIVLGNFLLTKFTRSKFVKFFNTANVETRNGQKIAWEKLHFINCKKVNS